MAQLFRASISDGEGPIPVLESLLHGHWLGLDDASVAYALQLMRPPLAGSFHATIQTLLVQSSVKSEQFIFWLSLLQWGFCIRLFLRFLDEFPTPTTARATSDFNDMVDSYLYVSLEFLLQFRSLCGCAIAVCEYHPGAPPQSNLINQASSSVIAAAIAIWVIGSQITS